MVYVLAVPDEDLEATWPVSQDHSDLQGDWDLIRGIPRGLVYIVRGQGPLSLELYEAEAAGLYGEKSDVSLKIKRALYKGPRVADLEAARPFSVYEIYRILRRNVFFSFEAAVAEIQRRRMACLPEVQREVRALASSIQQLEAERRVNEELMDDLQVPLVIHREPPREYTLEELEQMEH